MSVKDSPGFIVNRVLFPYLNEAVVLVAEGMKTSTIDQVMQRFGMPVGPLGLLDQIGLEIAASVATAMAPSMADRFEPNTAFARLVTSGWLGQKSGKGFYIHTGKRPVVNPLAENVLKAEYSQTASAVARALTPAARLSEARERMVLLMVNEAALALSEGLTTNAADLDLAMVLGTGWVPHRGGPLRYADTRGLEDVVKMLSEFSERYGKRFEPCMELRRRADSKDNFYPSNPRYS